MYYESAELQGHSTKQWMATTGYLTDLFTMAYLFQAVERANLQELTTSGENWERKQQHRLKKHGDRTYPLWLAHDMPNYHTFDEEIGQLIFDECSWSIAQDRTEHRQLQLFLGTSRAGGTS